MTTKTDEKIEGAALAKRSVINSLAERLDVDPAKLAPMLKRTAFSSCKTDEEFMAMCMVANTYGLNPILKEVYAFPGKNGAVVPIVGVDGWTKLMNRSPNFDGIEFDEAEDGSRCTAIIYRKDRTRPVKVTEWLDECKGITEPWKRWPRRMLRHKAMIQCARLAFGFAGIYDEDEAERIVTAQAENVRTVPAGGRGRRATAAEILGKEAAPAALPPAEDEDAPFVDETAAAETAAAEAPAEPQTRKQGDFLL